MLGRCPNCNLSLDEAVVTKESNIFKGNNRYVMCTNCGYIMAHNTRTNNLFGLERFQEDKEVLDDIQQLLSEIDENYEVVANEPEQHECTGNCASCQGCSGWDEPVVEEEPVEAIEEPPRKPPVIKDDSLLAIHKDTFEAQILSPDALDRLDIDKYDFYALDKVMIQPVVTYQIKRV
jgi:hypothetical protein